MLPLSPRELAGAPKSALVLQWGVSALTAKIELVYVAIAMSALLLGASIVLIGDWDQERGFLLLVQGVNMVQQSPMLSEGAVILWGHDIMYNICKNNTRDPSLVVTFSRIKYPIHQFSKSR